MGKMPFSRDENCTTNDVFEYKDKSRITQASKWGWAGGRMFQDKKKSLTKKIKGAFKPKGDGVVVVRWMYS